jgi:NAD(P)-dependent dehydrogenase (short-subunit alcohol dehydrogenase family)
MQSMFRQDFLKGKRILVSGGGSGLGRVMASHYAQHGATVHICGRRGQRLKTAAVEMSAQYRADVRAIVCEYLTGETIAIDGAQHLTASGTFGAHSGRTEDEWRQMRDSIKSANARDKAQRSVGIK